MSVTKAKSATRKLQAAAADPATKLNYIAQALVELAKTVGDIEDDVRRIKSKTGA